MVKEITAIEVSLIFTTQGGRTGWHCEYDEADRASNQKYAPSADRRKVAVRLGAETEFVDGGSMQFVHNLAIDMATGEPVDGQAAREAISGAIDKLVRRICGKIEVAGPRMMTALNCAANWPQDKNRYAEQLTFFGGLTWAYTVRDILKARMNPRLSLNNLDISLEKHVGDLISLERLLDGDSGKWFKPTAH